MKSPQLVGLLGVALLALSATACSSAATDTNEESIDQLDEQLVGGRPALESEYPSTVFLGFCTAAKVGPRHFLMAAHCVTDTNTNALSWMYAPGNSLSVNARNDNASEGYRYLTIQQVTIFPDWLTSCTSPPCGVNVLSPAHAPDIALAVVTTDTPDIPAASVDETTVVPGQQVTMTGYGCEAGIGQPWSGQYRFKLQEVTTLPASSLLHPGSYIGAGDEGNVAASYVLTPGVLFGPNDASLCPGDSGGPLYRQGTSLLVGVNAYYTFLDGSGVSYTNWHTRTDTAARYGVANWLRGLGANVVGNRSYTGTPWAMNTTIQAENYDLGGQGIGYSDTSSGNSGGKYRTDGVDIENTVDTGAGYNIGWVAAGEWLAYTVASAPGTYDLSLRLAAWHATPKIHVEVDGVNVTGSVLLPRTSGGQSWQTVTVPNLTLTGGQHVVRLAFETGSINANWLRFVPTSTCTDGAKNGNESAVDCGGRCGATCTDGQTCSAPTDCQNGQCSSGVCGPPVSQPYGGTPRSVTSTIQAEDYDTGGQNLAYYDIDVANNGNAYRTTESVDVQGTSDSGGGYNVGWTRPGEFLVYTVSVAQDGYYQLNFRASSGSAGNNISVAIDGNYATSFFMPKTTGYQTVTLNTQQSPLLHLTPGTHRIRFAFDGSGVNVNWFTFVKQ